MAFSAAPIVIVVLAAAVAAAVRRGHGMLFIAATSALFWSVVWLAASQMAGDPALKRLERLDRGADVLEAAAPRERGQVEPVVSAGAWSAAGRSP